MPRMLYYQNWSPLIGAVQFHCTDSSVSVLALTEAETIGIGSHCSIMAASRKLGLTKACKIVDAGRLWASSLRRWNNDTADISLLPKTPRIGISTVDPRFEKIVCNMNRIDRKQAVGNVMRSNSSFTGTIIFSDFYYDRIERWEFEV